MDWLNTTGVYNSTRFLRVRKSRSRCPRWFWIREVAVRMLVEVPPSSESLARRGTPHIFCLFGLLFKIFIELDTVLLLFYVLVFWPWGMWHLSSPTRVWTLIPCIRRQSLNHWATREIPRRPTSKFTHMVVGRRRHREKERQERERWRERESIRREFFINESGGAPYHHFCHILLVIRTNPWYNKGGDWLHESVHTGSRITGDHLW